MGFEVVNGLNGVNGFDGVNGLNGFDGGSCFFYSPSWTRGGARRAGAIEIKIRDN